VQALVARPGGGVIAGGSFTQAGGVAASNIASWDGVAWSPLGAGTNGPVRGLAALANGDIVAVGAFTTAGGAAASNVARWNGSSWAPLGGGLAGTYANAAAVLANGDLVVGGQFTLAGGVPANNIARWNGTSWFPLGSGVVGAFATTTEVRAMLVRGSELVVSGNFFLAGGIPVNGIASWNGTSWSAMGSSHGGYAFALTTLPNGDLVSNLFRWDGVVWTPLVSIWPGPWPAPEIRAMAKGPGDALLLGGSFTFIGHAASAYCAVSAYVAELTTTCPATVIPFGASCASSAGPMALTSTSLPWLGSTFTATATGMPASSIALAVTGFGTASLPLASILPQGVAGCFLWTTPDFVAAALPTAGSVSTQLAIPNQPALIGQVFHHQVVPVELAPTGGLLAVTSTNRLTALIGVF
jgi:hypothetical protein